MLLPVGRGPCMLRLRCTAVLWGSCTYDLWPRQLLSGACHEVKGEQKLRCEAGVVVVLLRPHRKWGKLLCGRCGRRAVVCNVWTSGGQSTLCWKWGPLRQTQTFQPHKIFRVTYHSNIKYVRKLPKHAHFWLLEYYDRCSHAHFRINSTHFEFKIRCWWAILAKDGALSMLVSIGSGWLTLICGWVGKLCLIRVSPMKCGWVGRSADCCGCDQAPPFQPSVRSFENMWVWSGSFLPATGVSPSNLVE